MAYEWNSMGSWEYHMEMESHIYIYILIGAFYVGNRWVAGGCWDDDITNVMKWMIMDHSRKFPV